MSILGHSEGGASVVEYAIVAGFIAAVIIASVIVLGAAVQDLHCAPLRAWQQFIDSTASIGEC